MQYSITMAENVVLEPGQQFPIPPPPARNMLILILKNLGDQEGQVTITTESSLEVIHLAAHQTKVIEMHQRGEVSVKDSGTTEVVVAYHYR